MFLELLKPCKFSTNKHLQRWRHLSARGCAGWCDNLGLFSAALPSSPIWLSIIVSGHLKLSMFGPPSLPPPHTPQLNPHRAQLIHMQSCAPAAVEVVQKLWSLYSLAASSANLSGVSAVMEPPHSDSLPSQDTIAWKLFGSLLFGISCTSTSNWESWEGGGGER